LCDILVFSVYKSGYNDYALCQILYNSIEYLQDKINKLKESPHSRQMEAATREISALEITVKNALLVLDNEESIGHKQKIMKTLKKEIKDFELIIENESDSIKGQLLNLNEILVKKMIEEPWD
jgi:hypothetical protein